MTAVSFDMVRFLKGDGRTWGMSHSWAADGHYGMQTGSNPGQYFLVKGFAPHPCHHEEFRYDADFVYRGFDTSPEDGSVYRLSDPGQPVSKWVPRHFGLNGWYRRVATVTRYHRRDGVKFFEGTHTTWIHFKALHPTWGGKNGYSVRNVAELVVYDGDDGNVTKKHMETYFFAEGIGMVGWNGPINGKSEASRVNFIWDMGQGPGLDREPLPPGLHYEPMNVPVDEPLPTPDPVPAPEPALWFLRPAGFPYVITSGFGPRETIEPKMHEGVDYAPAPTATQPYKVLSPRNGVVDYAGWTSDRKGYGRYVRIKHTINGEEWVSWLGHLDDIRVIAGQTVTAGQWVGNAGSTGNSNGTHLHWTLTNEARGVDGYAVRKVVNPADFNVVATVPGNAPTSPVPAPLPPPAPTPAPDAMLGLLEAADDAWQRVLELRRQRDDLLAMLDAAVWDFEAKQRLVSEARNELRRVA